MVISLTTNDLLLLLGLLVSVVTFMRVMARLLGRSKPPALNMTSSDALVEDVKNFFIKHRIPAETPTGNKGKGGMVKTARTKRLGSVVVNIIWNEGCKSNVGRDDVTRAAALGFAQGAQYVIVMTNCLFSQEAQEAAKEYKVHLSKDRNALEQFLKKNLKPV